MLVSIQVHLPSYLGVWSASCKKFKGIKAAEGSVQPTFDFDALRHTGGAEEQRSCIGGASSSEQQ